MLTLWKRHSNTCLKTAPLQKLKLEDRRFHKKCRCACWVTGNHPKTGEYLKKSLDTTSWEAAEKLMRALETSTPGEIEKQKTTVKQAFEIWFAEKRRLLVSERTLELAYTHLVLKVLKFAGDRGLTLISQFDKDEAFELVHSAGWLEWKPSTQKRQLSNLRGFFDFAVQREWLAKNSLDAIRSPKTDFIQVDPYTPEEEDLLEKAFRNWQPDSKGGQWADRPATLLCLTHVLRDTGLRISDAQRIRPAIIEVLPSGDGECTLRQTKLDSELATGDGEVTVYLAPETLAEMKRIPWVSAKYPFMAECAHEDDAMRWKRHLAAEGRKVYFAMQAVGETVGVADCRAHRYRHTFAVKHLINGMSLEKVSRLLGHKDIRTTQKYYAKWSNKRQEQLRDEVIGQRERERGAVQMPQAG